MLDEEEMFVTSTTTGGNDWNMRWLATAAELYEDVTFQTNSVFNEPAPEPWIAFLIGAIFSALGFLMWVRRVYLCKEELDKLNIPFTGTTCLRAMISRAVDNDDPAYTVASFGAFSFLFLGGLQLSYQWTLIAMIITYAVASFGDSARILLSVSNAKSLSEVIHTSHIVQSQMRTVQTDLNPSNVYEDLGRGKTIVIMVFLTQMILIAFVFVDLYENQTHSCVDGSANCPVAGTLGSWGFYVLGIFMACVYLLGPKTNFGQSEQNPAYWIQLLIAAKNTGVKITWFDPVENQTMERKLSPDDFRIWIRFFMSYLINGVGFHILVHALPIQVAAQSSLTGVVFRAVGMIYLVDLDDTAGYTLTVVERPPEKKEDENNGNPPSTPQTDVGDGKEQPTDRKDVSDEADRIINEARAKLDALAQGNYTRNNQNNMNKMPSSKLAAAAILTAAELANAEAERNEQPTKDKYVRDEGEGHDIVSGDHTGEGVASA